MAANVLRFQLNDITLTFTKFIPVCGSCYNCSSSGCVQKASAIL